MAYKITVQDGPVTVTVETDTADAAAAVLAVSVLQKVQRSKSFDPPRPTYYWDGPDRNVQPDWRSIYPPGTVLCTPNAT